MDLSHSGWSASSSWAWIFPLGWAPNVSIDLGVRGRDAPPAAADLSRSSPHRPTAAPPDQRRPEVQGRTITALADVFDFAKDYLGLLKAAVYKIAAGIIPAGNCKCSGHAGRWPPNWLDRGCSRDRLGKVNDIPKAWAWPFFTTCWRPATVRSQAEAGEVMTTWLPIIGGMFVLGITLLWIAARRN